LERTDEIRWHECQGRLLPLNRNVTGMTVYVRIRDSEFWIEEDWTENGIATDLVLAGVPKEDIVLAFHEPKMRQYTEFAVAS
jgi:hypothetical protein